MFIMYRPTILKRAAVCRSTLVLLFAAHKFTRCHTTAGARSDTNAWLFFRRNRICAVNTRRRISTVVSPYYFRDCGDRQLESRPRDDCDKYGHTVTVKIGQVLLFNRIVQG